MDTDSLQGTAWAGTDSDGDDYVFEYLDGGVLRYTSPTGTFTNGTWTQNGDQVSMEMNDRYSEYEGIIEGSRISGSARNVKGHRWRFSVQKQ